MYKRSKKIPLDAPLVPTLYIIGGISILIFVAIFHNYEGYGWTIFYGVLMVLGGVIYVNTSLRGKDIIWNRIIESLHIDENDDVLDLGTGHGLVLLKFARLLSSKGSATGIDLWKNVDQADNSMENTNKIISSKKFKADVNVQTADMVKLPFENEQYDYVVSSLAFHNIKPKLKRTEALLEATRVLKSGGTLIIVDTGHKQREYVSTLKKQGLKNIRINHYGVIGWWTGPWMATYSIIAEK